MPNIRPSTLKYYYLRREAGLCISCKTPSAYSRCPACALLHQERIRDIARNRYRKRHGIPLDAPIKSGRKRKNNQPPKL